MAAEKGVRPSSSSRNGVYCTLSTTSVRPNRGSLFLVRLSGAGAKLRGQLNGQIFAPNIFAKILRSPKQQNSLYRSSPKDGTSVTPRALQNWTPFIITTTMCFFARTNWPCQRPLPLGKIKCRGCVNRWRVDGASRGEECTAPFPLLAHCTAAPSRHTAHDGSREDPK